MKKFGKVLALMLAVLTVVSLLPVTALADGVSLFKFDNESEETIIDVPEVFDGDITEIDEIADITDEYVEVEDGTVAVQSADNLEKIDSESEALTGNVEVYVYVQQPDLTDTSKVYLIGSTKIEEEIKFLAVVDGSLTTTVCRLYEGEDFTDGAPFVIASTVNSASNWSIYTNEKGNGEVKNIDANKYLNTTDNSELKLYASEVNLWTIGTDLLRNRNNTNTSTFYDSAKELFKMAYNTSGKVYYYEKKTVKFPDSIERTSIIGKTSNPKYVYVDSITSGNEYLLASGNTAGDAYIAVNSMILQQNANNIYKMPVKIYEGTEITNNAPYIRGADVTNAEKQLSQDKGTTEARGRWIINGKPSQQNNINLLDTSIYISHNSSELYTNNNDTKYWWYSDHVFSYYAAYIRWGDTKLTEGSSTASDKEVYLFEKAADTFNYYMEMQIDGVGYSYYSLYEKDVDKDGNHSVTLTPTVKPAHDLIGLSDTITMEQVFGSDIADFDPETGVVTFKKDDNDNVYEGKTTIRASCKYDIYTLVSYITVENNNFTYEANITMKNDDEKVVDAGTFGVTTVAENEFALSVTENGEAYADYDSKNVVWTIEKGSEYASIVGDGKGENVSIKFTDYGTITLKGTYNFADGNCFDTVRVKYKDASDMTGSDVELDKTVIMEEDDTYSLVMEAYATGYSLFSEEVNPVTTTLLLDVSRSMNGAIDETPITVNDEVRATAAKYPFYYTHNNKGTYLYDWGLRYDAKLSRWECNKADGTWVQTTQYKDGDSVYLSRFGALILSVKAFFTQMAESALTLPEGENHYYSIVLFAMGRGTNYQIASNIKLELDSSIEDKTERVQDAVDKAIELISNKFVNNLNTTKCHGYTEVSEGIKNVESYVIEADNSTYTGEKFKNYRKTMVIFTDGVPTNGANPDAFQANEACESLVEATKLKNMGIEIYTVGFIGEVEGVNSGYEKIAKYDFDYVAPVTPAKATGSQQVNSFLNLISSNFPDAYVIGGTTSGWDTTNIYIGDRNKEVTSVDKSYYLAAESADELENVFSIVGRQVAKFDKTLTLSSCLKDVISKDFAVPDDFITYPKKYITAEVYSITEDGEWEFDPLVTNNLDYYPAVDANTGLMTIVVTNFDYMADENIVMRNYTRDENGNYTSKFFYTGRKVVLKIKGIKNISGTGDVATNDPSSGIYVNKGDSEPITPLPVPVVEVKYFLVYHSSAKGDESKYVEKLSENYLDEDGNIDLTERVYDLRDPDNNDDDKTDNKVHYIYGGLYTDGDFDTPYDSDGLTEAYGEGNVNGKVIHPILADNDDDCSKYYIKEVDDRYLRPKTTTTEYYGLLYTNMITAVDTLNYQLVGFDFTDLNYVDTEGEKVEVAKAKETVEVWNSETSDKRVYNKLWYKMTNGNIFEYYLRNGDIVKSEEAKVIQNSLFNNIPYSATEGYMVAIEHKSFNKLTYGYENEYNINFQGIPYYITMDGIRVYGVINRDFLYKSSVRLEKDNDEADNPTVVDTFVASKTSVEEIVASPINVNDSLRYSKAKTLLSKSNPIITKNYDDGTDTQAVLNGDNVGKVWHRAVEGKLFAGWFADKDRNASADFSNVQSNLRVYAKYVSDDYLGLNIIANKTKETITSITFISAIDSKNYAGKGFEISANGNTAKYEVEQFSSAINSIKPNDMFGGDVSNTAKLFSYTYNTTAIADGTEITVTPYWITGDGTVVYGDSKVINYNRNSIVG